MAMKFLAYCRNIDLPQTLDIDVKVMASIELSRLRMKTGFWTRALPVILVVALVSLQGEAQAVSTRVVATVNDLAISAYQVRQRVKLLRVMRPTNVSKKQQEKNALQDLIDDKLKDAEAKKLRFALTRQQAAEVIENTEGIKQLAANLKKQGLSQRLVTDFIITRMSWNRILSQKYKIRPPTQEQIDAKYRQLQREMQKFAKNQSLTIYQLMPLTLPVDRQATRELTNEVARSRLIEADRITKRFKGCGSARKAARGIFNVKIGKRFPADPTKMPKQMRRTLDKFGPGSAFVMGVAPGASSVQIMAYCGKRKVTPQLPKISPAEVKRQLEDEQFENLGRSYLRGLRKNAFIEYKDTSLRK